MSMKKLIHDNPYLFFIGILLIGGLINNAMKKEDNINQSQYGNYQPTDKPVSIYNPESIYNPKLKEKPEPINEPEPIDEPEPLKETKPKEKSDLEKALNNMGDSWLRKGDIINKKKFKYIYKDNAPFGENVSISYDEFYSKYYVTFNGEDGQRIEIALAENSFYESEFNGDVWRFKYKGTKYRIETKVLSLLERLN